MKFNLKKYNRNTLGGLLLHMALACVIVLIVSILYFYAYLPSLTNHGETITVPNVEGLPFEKVEQFLSNHDLRYEVGDSSFSSQYPPLTVLKQFPVPGAKVKENRKVYLTVNRVKPPTVAMPDLVDKSLINAEEVLKGSELKRGKIILVRGPWLNLVQEMRINGNKIVPGVRVPKGTVVDLVVMDGGSIFLPTPNVLRFPYDEAEFSIKGSNLNVGNITLLSDTTGGEAVVLKQKPTPNENIKVGDVVHLWIGNPDSDVPDDTTDGLDDNQDND
jgi:eukaryotic-like serine/threonine-protein kinase